ncbi:uncharacterized protein ARMOST_02986 [Armillaria ostoyae]|uniref:Uncharacterized protein n=1 Tax=Armillaria ostoyae TaxID=47428 RepID=A0A284QT72_ARMOS|nr:uncharacterized protein ARMOST_02986 [Armillaria ostoyae]
MSVSQPSFFAVGGHDTVVAEGYVIDGVDWAEIAVKGVISMQGSQVVQMEGCDSLVTYMSQPLFTRLTNAYPSNDTAILTSDSGSVSRFTPVNNATVDDHSEYLCSHTTPQIVSADQIPLNTVSVHLCWSAMNLISNTGDPVRLVSLAGVRGESASYRDASR